MLVVFTSVSNGTVTVNSSRVINCCDERDDGTQGGGQEERREELGKPASKNTVYLWAENRFPFSVKRKKKKKRLKLDGKAGLRGHVDAILAPLFVFWRTVINF